MEVDSYIAISGSNPRIKANFLNKIIYYDRARYASVIYKKNRKLFSLNLLTFKFYFI